VGALPAGGVGTGPVVAFGVGAFSVGAFSFGEGAAVGEVGVGKGVCRMTVCGATIIGDGRRAFFSNWLRVSGRGVGIGAVCRVVDTLDSEDGICVSPAGRRGARSRRTEGCRLSCCTSELAIAGRVNPATAPLHASASSARHPICPCVRTATAYGAAGCSLLLPGVVDWVSMPVWLDPPLATSRMMVAVIASSATRIATAAPTASAVEWRRGEG
jgi:hypothetical protein